MMMMVKPRLIKMMIMKIMITIVVSADGVGLWCVRTRVRFPVMLHPCFIFSPFCVALTSFEYHWKGALMEKGGGGGVKWAHSRPKVYQLLLSRVIDVKYGCFTFTFCLYGVKQSVRKKVIVMMVMIVVVVVVVEVVMEIMVRTILKRC